MEYEVTSHGLARDQFITSTKSYTTKDCGQWYNPVSWVKRGAVELSLTLGIDHTYRAGGEE